jgi:catechol 2,3-dioxygenase-like lactoylglutathione lyase family enzyme
VWDAEASLAFYSETLGLPLTAAITGDGWGGMRWLMMMFGLDGGRELVLAAFEGAKPPPGDDLPEDARHYAFSVASEAERIAWRDKIAAAGLRFWEENHGDQMSIYLPDPNGVILEITSPASDAGRTADPAALARARAWIEAAALSAESLTP